MRRISGLLVVFVLGCLLGIAAAGRADSVEIPRPEHPFPQMQRDEWLNLNGIWEFGETNADESARFLSAESYPEHINVPFCREAPLSGIDRTELVKNVWYRRTFRVPASWPSPRVLFHVGACDYRATVWINGTRVGHHQGGNAPFAFDITNLIDRAGENTVVVHAFDETNGNQPLGKQSPRGKGYEIFYTPTTGIWQTVWLEGVGSEYLKDIAIDPDPKTSRVHLNLELAGGDFAGLELRATARLEGKDVGSQMRPAQWRNNRIEIALSELQLWMPGDPALYDLDVELLRDGKVIDKVASYFGMRDVTIDGRAILINDKAIFQRLVLDQGFYPQGIWTAPTDAALAGDIDLAMAAGFNGARLHQKVFEPRFLYHADRKGYLVWGEYPSYHADYNLAITDTRVAQEWVELIKRDRSHPSIIGWCPFNEMPDEAKRLQETMLELTRALDPSRPALETSGWTHAVSEPEMVDVHDYERNPDAMRRRYASKFLDLPARYGVGTAGQIPFFVSEYGGIGWDIKEGGWGYNETPRTKEAWFERFKGLADAQLDNRMLCGFCYTQLTDIEQEQNGVYYYDRRAKFDTAALHAALSREAAYEKDPPLARTLRTAKVEWQVLAGSSHDGRAEWKYAQEKPAENWASADFDASAWATGIAPFGNKDGWNDKVATPWKSADLWLRRTFEWDGSDFDQAYAILHHDDNAEIFLNGKKILEAGRWNNGYEAFEVAAAVRAALQKGTNTLAVHIHQDGGGQFFDMALLAGKSPAK